MVLEILKCSLKEDVGLRDVTRVDCKFSSEWGFCDRKVDCTFNWQFAQSSSKIGTDSNERMRGENTWCMVPLPTKSTGDDPCVLFV